MFDLHRRHQATLVLITHDLKLAQRCRRTVQMADGQITSGAKKVEAA